MSPDGSVFEGKTLDDAVRKGLDTLGLSRAEAMITVLAEGSGGFLGLGARPYRVRVQPRPGGAPREPEEREGRGRDRDRDSRRGGRGGRDRERGGRDRNGRRGGRDREERRVQEGGRREERRFEGRRQERRPEGDGGRREERRPGDERRAEGEGGRREERRHGGERRHGERRREEPRELRGGREGREGRGPREGREGREGRERRELREPREGREQREGREREGREPREVREPRETRPPREETPYREARPYPEERPARIEEPREPEPEVMETAGPVPSAAAERPESGGGDGSAERESRRRRRRGRRGGRGRRREGMVGEGPAHEADGGAREEGAEPALEPAEAFGAPETFETTNHEPAEESFEERPAQAIIDEGDERDDIEDGTEAPMADVSAAPGSSATPVSQEALAAEGRRVTEELLRQMGFDAKVEATSDGEHVDVMATVSADDELLTGRKGETRQALQHLLNRMINKGGGSQYHLQLEINDFWKRRETELAELARSLAEEALAKNGEAVTEYLNSQERRIIHVTLRDDTRVKTYALGTGLIKRLAVAPADFPEGAPDER